MVKSQPSKPDADVLRDLSELTKSVYVPEWPYLMMSERDREHYRNVINGIPFRGAVTADEVKRAVTSPL
jgi:hypothetical protein